MHAWWQLHGLVVAIIYVFVGTTVPFAFCTHSDRFRLLWEHQLIAMVIIDGSFNFLTNRNCTHLWAFGLAWCWSELDLWHVLVQTTEQVLYQLLAFCLFLFPVLNFLIRKSINWTFIQYIFSSQDFYTNFRRFLPVQ
jgi:hypothetical protein